MPGTSAFNNVVFSGPVAKDFGMSEASTTNLTIEASSGAVTAPWSKFTITGNYSNATTSGFNSNFGTTTLNGTSQQTLSGTMVGSSAWNNLAITNTSQEGSTTPSIIFANVASTTDTLTMLASTSAQLLANATSTFTNINLLGSSGQYVTLRSSSPNTQYNFYVPGIQRSVTYVDVRDSNACGATITALNTLDSGNNTCWSISASAGLTLSGAIYSDEGFTAIINSKDLTIAIGTSTPSLHVTTTDGLGNWSFNIPAGHLITLGTPLSIYVDGDATTRASLFTKASTTGNITGLNLYQNRVIISREGTSGTTTRISDMSFYDGDDDSDIQYTANGGVLTVRTGNELHIKDGKTFEPRGAVIIHGNGSSTSMTDGSFHLPGTARYYATSTLTLGGSFLASSTATYVASSTIATSSGTIFTATTTGKSVLAPLTTLGSTTFNGTNGGWTFATTSTTSNLTIRNGTVTAPTTTLTITGNYTNDGTFTHNGGTVTFSTSTATSTYTGFSFDTAVVSGNFDPFGITTYNGYFWVVDGQDAEVYKYTLDGTYTGVSFDTAVSGNDSPYGITTYNGYFWITDNADDEVYKYTADGTYTGVSFDTAASGNSDPYGITPYNGYFWITDNTDDEVYKYTAGGTYTGTSFDTAGSGNFSSYGITTYKWLLLGR